MQNCRNDLECIVNNVRVFILKKDVTEENRKKAKEVRWEGREMSGGSWEG